MNTRLVPICHFYSKYGWPYITALYFHICLHTHDTYCKVQTFTCPSPAIGSRGAGFIHICNVCLCFCAAGWCSRPTTGPLPSFRAPINTAYVTLQRVAIHCVSLSVHNIVHIPFLLMDLTISHVIFIFLQCWCRQFWHHVKLVYQSSLTWYTHSLYCIHWYVLNILTW